MKLKNKWLELLKKCGSLVIEYVRRIRLPRRMTQLVVSLSMSGLMLVLLLGLFLLNIRQIQAAPSPRPLAAPGTIVTHTAVGSATHQMTVFGNGQLTNQFLTDNISRTNQIGAGISHTTIAVLFDQHTGNAVDVGSQLEFVETTPVFTGPSGISGYYEESYGVYASQLPSPSYQIAQRTLVTSGNNCVIMELTISNTDVISLTGGKLLYMVDIQVGEHPDDDQGGFDPGRQMVYQTDFNDDTEYGYAFGISLLSGDLRGYAVQDDSYLDPALDLVLRDEMITPTNAITDGDDDVSWLVVNIPTLPPLQSTYLAFNLCAQTADSESEALVGMNDTFDSVSSLSAVKTSVPGSGSAIATGYPLTYTIAVSSTGSWYVDNIVLTDTIPTGTNLITYSVTQGSITATGQLVTATIGRLASASDTVTVTIVVDPQASAFSSGIPITNQAFIDSQPIITRSNIVTHYPAVLTITKQSNSAWPLQQMLIFTNSASLENLVDFPVLVKLDGTRIDYSQTLTDGQDLRFVDADGTLLAHEIEEWNGGGTSYVWVKIPQIDGSNADYIWMLYGNSTTDDGQDPENVWNAGYEGIWHLNESAVDGASTATHYDSTVNNNNGTQNGNGYIAGQISGGQDFNDVNEYIEINGLLGQPADVTLSAWVRLDTHTNNGNDAISIGDYVAIRVDDDSRPAIPFTVDSFFYDGGGWSFTYPIGGYPAAGQDFHYVVYTYDSAFTQTLYINGQEVAVTTYTDPISYIGQGSNTFIGRHGNANANFDFQDGIIDEVRVSSVARSSSWITAQYLSMTDNFITFNNAEPANSSQPGIIGAAVTYTLTITKGGSGTLTNLVVSDTLPTGANYISGGDSFAGTDVQWNIADFTLDTQQQVTFIVSTCQESLVNSDYQVVSSDQNIKSPMGTPVPTLLTPPIIDAQMTFSPLTVTLNSPVYFTNTTTSDGGAITKGQWNFGDGSSVSGLTSSHVYTNAGTYTVTLTVTDTCGYTDTITNTVSVYIPNLTLAKQADSSVVQPSDQLTYTLAVSNTGLAAATNVVVTDTIPVNTSFVTATLPHLGPVGGVITWSLDTLDVDETSSLTMVVLIDSDVVSGTIITNTAWLTNEQAVTDTDTVTTLVEVGSADLSIAKTADPPVVDALAPLTYTLTISNSGPDASFGITVTDTLPAGVIYGGAGGSGWSCSQNSGVVTCTRSSLLVGISSDIVITVTAPITAGIIVNTAEVTATVTDLDHTNNISTTDVLVIGPGPANIGIVKTGPATAAVDQAVTYSFSVSTDITVTTVTVTDTVVGPAAYVSGDNGNNLLDPGENWIYTVDYEISPFDPVYLQNTGYVSATDIYGNNIIATDTHTTAISFNPGLVIQKSGPAVARVGDTVVYDIYVTNATTNTFFNELGALSIGDGSPITITQVTDSLGLVTYIDGDNGDNRLSGTEQWRYRITHTIQFSIPNPLLSQASVRGLDMERDEITDTTTMRTDIDTTIYSDIFLPIIFKD